MKDALLTNAAYQVITRVPWRRAITLVVLGLVALAARAARPRLVPV